MVVDVECLIFIGCLTARFGVSGYKFWKREGEIGQFGLERAHQATNKSCITITMERFFIYTIIFRIILVLSTELIMKIDHRKEFLKTNLSSVSPSP